MEETAAANRMYTVEIIQKIGDDMRNRFGEVKNLMICAFFRAEGPGDSAYRQERNISENNNSTNWCQSGDDEYVGSSTNKYIVSVPKRIYAVTE